MEPELFEKAIAFKKGNRLRIIVERRGESGCAYCTRSAVEDVHPRLKPVGQAQNSSIMNYAACAGGPALSFPRVLGQGQRRRARVLR